MESRPEVVKVVRLLVVANMQSCYIQTISSWSPLDITKHNAVLRVLCVRCARRCHLVLAQKETETESLACLPTKIG